MRIPRPQLPKTPLQCAREAVGISQARLAREAGVHPASIGLAERAGCLSPAMAERLAAILGVTADELLGQGSDD